MYDPKRVTKSLRVVGWHCSPIEYRQPCYKCGKPSSLLVEFTEDVLDYQYGPSGYVDFTTEDVCNECMKALENELGRADDPIAEVLAKALAKALAKR